MIAIVHSIYSQSVHAPALNAGLTLTYVYLYIICVVHVLIATIPHVTGNKLNCFI